MDSDDVANAGGARALRAVPELPRADPRIASQSLRNWRAHRPPAKFLLLLYVAYLLTGALGEGLALIPGVSIMFWPPVGVLIATLLLNPRASWPWWILVGGLAELSWNALGWHSPLPFALIYFSANAFEAVLAASLLLRLGGRPFRLDSLKNVGLLVVCGAVIAPVVSATIIASTDALIGKHAFWTAWPLVWLGDGTGLLVSTPLTLVAAQAWRARGRIALNRVTEALLLIVLLMGITGLAFSGWLPTAYLALPVVLWAALRFHVQGAAAAIGLIALATALYTAEGSGEFTGDPGAMHDRIVGLQTFLGVSAISAFLVAALAQERQRALDALRALNAQLEARVADRTATLRAREAELSAADRQKDEFIAMLAHELRNPLASIHNVGEWLKRVFGADPRASMILPMLERQTQQLTRLVDDLLDVSRIAQGRIVLQESVLELGEIVAQALESVQPLLREKGHRVVRVPDPVPSIHVHGDRVRLVQCIGNVLHNAAKYTDPGGEIRITIRGSAAEVTIEIRDDGAGIAPELLPRVFDLFVQSTQTLDRSQGGLGIGLSVVKRLVEMHGGAVSAASAGLGRGSTFTIRLPTAQAPAAASRDTAMG